MRGWGLTQTTTGDKVEMRREPKWRECEWKERMKGLERRGDGCWVEWKGSGPRPKPTPDFSSGGRWAFWQREGALTHTYIQPTHTQNKHTTRHADSPGISDAHTFSLKPSIHLSASLPWTFNSTSGTRNEITVKRREGQKKNRQFCLWVVIWSHWTMGHTSVFQAIISIHV